MRWKTLLSEAAAGVAGEFSRIPEKSSGPVAQAFFDEEIYPRMQKLQATIAQSGKYEAVLQPSPHPPEGIAWRLEHISLRVFRLGESTGQLSSIAYLSFEYRVNLLCDVEAVTKSGWRNLGVFWLAGNPIEYIEPSIEEFLKEL